MINIQTEVLVLMHANSVYKTVCGRYTRKSRAVIFRNIYKTLNKVNDYADVYQG